MTYKSHAPRSAAKTNLTEWRGRITEEQKRQLEELEENYGIPQSAIVRLALKIFLPLTKNQGFKAEGIADVIGDEIFFN